MGSKQAENFHNKYTYGSSICCVDMIVKSGEVLADRRQKCSPADNIATYAIPGVKTEIF